MRSRAAVVAILAFVLIATACAVLTVRMTARATDEAAAAQAAEAPEIARLYIAKYGSLSAAAPTIVKRIARKGLHVAVLDIKTGSWYSAGGHVAAAAGAHGTAASGNRPDSSGRPKGFADGPGSPDGNGAFRRSDWIAIFVTALAGETPHHALIPGGVVAIFPEPEPILSTLRSVGLGLSFVLFCSGTTLWFCVRGIRRAALRPLNETTLALERLALRDFAPRTIMAGEGSAYDELARAYNAAAAAVSSAFAERRAAESEMQRFIADAGHELRTPLTIVTGYLDIIEGGALADPHIAKRITTGMRTEAMRMRKLVEKLIILARMETPTDLDARTDIDIVSLVQRVIESLEPLTTQTIEVIGVPFAHVFASEDDIAEALSNLIENGIKYAPLTRIEVSIERTADRIVIAVADRGPGMSADEQRNAFERFYRGDQRGEVSGSGLGLAIAKRAVERARGTIRLQSTPGTGTTCTIELPEMPISVSGSRTSRLAHR